MGLSMMSLKQYINDETTIARQWIDTPVSDVQATRQQSGLGNCMTNQLSDP